MAKNKQSSNKRKQKQKQKQKEKQQQDTDTNGDNNASTSPDATDNNASNTDISTDINATTNNNSANASTSATANTTISSNSVFSFYPPASAPALPPRSLATASRATKFEHKDITAPPRLKTAETKVPVTEPGVPDDEVPIKRPPWPSLNTDPADRNKLPLPTRKTKDGENKEPNDAEVIKSLRSQLGMHKDQCRIFEALVKKRDGEVLAQEVYILELKKKIANKSTAELIQDVQQLGKKNVGLMREKFELDSQIAIKDEQSGKQDQAMEELRAANKTLHEEKNTLHEECNTLHNENARQNSTIETLNRQVASQKEEIDALKTQSQFDVNGATEHGTQLQNIVAEYEAEIQKLKGEEKSRHNTAQVDFEQRQVIENQLSEARRELTIAGEKLAQTEQNLQISLAHGESLHSACETLNAQCEEQNQYKGLLDNCQAEMTELKAETETLIRQRDDERAQVTRIKDFCEQRIRQADADKANWENDMATVQSQLEEKEAKNAELEKDWKRLNGLENDNRTEKAVLEVDRETLSGDRETLRGLVGKYWNDKAVLDEEWKKLSGTMEVNRSKEDDNRMKEAAFEEERKRLSGQEDDYQIKKAVVEEDMKKLSSRAVDWDNEKAVLENDLALRLNQLDQLQAGLIKVENHNTELQKDKEDLGREIDLLRKQRNALEAGKAMLETEVSNFKALAKCRAHLALATLDLRPSEAEREAKSKARAAANIEFEKHAKDYDLSTSRRKEHELAAADSGPTQNKKPLKTKSSGTQTNELAKMETIEAQPKEPTKVESVGTQTEELVGVESMGTQTETEKPVKVESIGIQTDKRVKVKSTGLQTKNLMEVESIGTQTDKHVEVESAGTKTDDSTSVAPRALFNRSNKSAVVFITLIAAFFFLIYSYGSDYIAASTFRSTWESANRLSNFEVVGVRAARDMGVLGIHWGIPSGGFAVFSTFTSIPGLSLGPCIISSLVGAILSGDAHDKAMYSLGTWVSHGAILLG